MCAYGEKMQIYAQLVGQEMASKLMVIKSSFMCKV